METTETSTSAPVDVWVNSGDHKRLGRVWIIVGLLALLVGGATGGILGAEKAATGLDVLDSDNFLQIYSVHAVSAVFGFLIPVWIGLAMVVVPLQIGARNLALPRLAAYATWLYVIGVVVVEAAYLDGGGPGTTDADASELWVLGLGLVVVALVAASTSIVTTIIGGRIPGMTMADAPAFTWSMLIAASLWVITLPVVASSLLLGWMAVHFGANVLPTSDALLAPMTWYFGPPQIYLLAVPAIGVAAEALRIFTGSPARPWPALVAGMGGLAALGFGALANPFSGADTPTGFIWHVMGIAVVAPALIVVAALADIVRQKQGSIRVTAPVLFAAGIVGAVVLGVATGMAQSTDRLDLAGTTWVSSQAHYIGLGAATLGVIAGLQLWSTKTFGGLMNDTVAKVSFALLFIGTNLLVIPDLFTGVDGMPVAAPFYDSGSLDTWETLSQLSGIGGALAIGGAVLAVLNVVSVLSVRSRDIEADPFDADGLEWVTASPPSAANFDSVPEFAGSGR